jgi:hypothetical protein
MNEPGFPKLWPLMHFDQVKRHEFITSMRNLPQVMLRAPVCPRGLNAPPAAKSFEAKAQEGQKKIALNGQRGLTTAKPIFETTCASAAAEVLLPIAAVAVGMTVLGLVFHIIASGAA